MRGLTISSLMRLLLAGATTGDLTRATTSSSSDSINSLESRGRLLPCAKRPEISEASGLKKLKEVACTETLAFRTRSGRRFAAATTALRAVVTGAAGTSRIRAKRPLIRLRSGIGTVGFLDAKSSMHF